jgi:hypothetical protein
MWRLVSARRGLRNRTRPCGPASTPFPARGTGRSTRSMSFLPCGPAPGERTADRHLARCGAGPWSGVTTYSARSRRLLQRAGGDQVVRAAHELYAQSNSPRAAEGVLSRSAPLLRRDRTRHPTRCSGPNGRWRRARYTHLAVRLASKSSAECAGPQRSSRAPRRGTSNDRVTMPPLHMIIARGSELH